MSLIAESSAAVGSGVAGATRTDRREGWTQVPGARRAPPRRHWSAFAITGATVALAVGLGHAMWDSYMGAPWTRDGTVRADVATVAPEVEGRIVALPIADNRFVHKGDLLLQIDPTNYRIAVRQAEATLRQAEASAQAVGAQLDVQQAQIAANEGQVGQAAAGLVFAKQEASRYSALAKTTFGTVQNAQRTAAQERQQEAGLASAQAALALARRQIEALKAQQSNAEAAIAQAQAQLDQAKVNLERTEVRSPVNGWVTNLLIHNGDFASVGATKVSVVDAQSYWLDGYFEETELERIHVGDPATIKLMGYHELVRGHVASIAHGINVANAQPSVQGLAAVNPIFTWVRLAQRIPVRIDIDAVPDGVTLSAGMTATVEIHRPAPGRADGRG